MIRPVLFVVALYTIAWIAASRIDPSPKVQKLAFYGLLLRVVGLLARRWVIGAVYGGASDTPFYHEQASILIRASREGIEPRFLGYGERGADATQLVKILEAVYRVIGVSELAGFFVFALFGWIGAYCFYRAAVIALPSIDRNRYALLLFTMPTLVYWPTSIGKDAWMIMMLGVTTLGAALTSQKLGNPVGLLFLVGGMFGAGVIRGHLVAIAAVAYVVANLWPRRGHGAGRTIVTVALAVGVLTFASSALSSTFGSSSDDGGSRSVGSILDQTTFQTSQGGSQFTPARVTTPLNLPLGIFTVLFRPLPLIDTRSPQQLVGALETVTLLVVTIKSRARLREALRLFSREVHIRFAATYTLAFIIPFSYIANFGILARQRTQVMPLFFVLLSVAVAHSMIDEEAESCAV